MAHQLDGLFVLRGRAWSLCIYYGIPPSLVNHPESIYPENSSCFRPLALIARSTIHASFHEGYDRLSEHLITQAQARLDLLREEKLWDAEMRPIRNVMARLRLKVRELGLETINMHETGYILIKNPKWRSPREQ